MDWNETMARLRPEERSFVKDVVDTLELFQLHHEIPAKLKLTGKYHDGATVLMESGWPKPKNKAAA